MVEATPPSAVGYRETQETVEHSGGKLRGNLGVPAIVLMVVAAAAPLSTIGGNVPIGMSLGNTTGMPVAFLVAGAIFLVFAAGFVAMSRYVKDAGAFYAYIERGLGRRSGAGAAALALPAYMATLLAVSAYDGVILRGLITQFHGPAIPWWVLTLIVLIVVAFLGYRDIDLSARVLGVFLVCEVAILLAVDFVVVLRGGSHGITGDSFTPQGLRGGFGIALLYALWGFVGVEATAVFRDEARDPDHTIPRATYWAVGIVAAFYAFSSWALVEGNGGHDAIAAAKADPDNFMVNTARRYLGAVGADLTNVFWFVSVFACALAFHNICARYTFVLSQNRLIAARFGEVHGRHGAPSNASVLVSILSIAVMVFLVAIHLDPVVQIFGPLGGIGIFALAVLWLLTSISVAIYFKRLGRTPVVVLGLVGAVALAACLILVVFNLNTVIGGTTTLSAIVTCVLVAVFGAGWLRSRSVSPAPMSRASAGERESA